MATETYAKHILLSKAEDGVVRYALYDTPPYSVTVTTTDKSGDINTSSASLAAVVGGDVVSLSAELGLAWNTAPTQATFKAQFYDSSMDYLSASNLGSINSGSADPSRFYLPAWMIPSSAAYVMIIAYIGSTSGPFFATNLVPLDNGPAPGSYLETTYDQNLES